MFEGRANGRKGLFPPLFPFAGWKNLDRANRPDDDDLLPLMPVPVVTPGDSWPSFPSPPGLPAFGTSTSCRRSGVRFRWEVAADAVRIPVIVGESTWRRSGKLSPSYL